MLGWLGLLIINFSAVPTILGMTKSMPPVSMVVLVSVGILLFVIDAYQRQQYEYAIGSGIGLIFQLIILYKILI